MEEAVESYRDGRVTLWRAAEMAVFSLREMMDMVRERKIPVSYTPEDLRRDVDYVRRKARGEQ